MASDAVASQSQMDQLLEVTRQTNQLLQTMVQNQFLHREETRAMKAVLQEVQEHVKNQLWYQEQALSVQQIQECRQSITTPDGNDTWRHADQVASGELWTGSDPIWRNLAAQVQLRITSKGQLPAECDLRRGQYRAVQKFLQKHKQLCTTKAAG